MQEEKADSAEPQSAKQANLVGVSQESVSGDGATRIYNSARSACKAVGGPHASRPNLDLGTE